MEAGENVRHVIESQAEAWDMVMGSQYLEWTPEGRILCVGSGTSYYIALVVAALGQQEGFDIVARPTQDLILDGTEIVEKFDSMIVISRSGETSEALWAAELSRGLGKFVLGVTCNSGSRLVDAVSHAWELPYGYDHTIVMVRSFTSMLFAFQCALTRHSERGTQTLKNIVQHADKWITHAAEMVGEMMTMPPRRVYILGAGVRYGIAEEGALKSLEMSNENATAYGPLEFRHGPWGSVTESDLVVMLGQSRYGIHERSVLLDLAERTNRLLVIAQKEWFSSRGLPGQSLILPEGDDRLMGPLAVIPLQWLGWYWAIAMGKNPDAPTSLTEVVGLTYGK